MILHKSRQNGSTRPSLLTAVKSCNRQIPNVQAKFTGLFADPRATVTFKSYKENTVNFTISRTKSESVKIFRHSRA